MLNQDTLLLVQFCVTLLTTALLVMAAVYTESLPEQRWWATGNVVVAMGVGLTSLDGIPVLLGSVLGYGVLALGIMMVWYGLQVYCAEAVSRRWMAALVLLALLVPAWFTYWYPSLRARTCFSGFFFALCTWLCAVTLARHGNWRGVCASVIGFGATGLSMFMRGVHMLFYNKPVDESSSLVMGVTMLVIPLGQICIATGLILMVMWRHAERLRQLSTLDPLTGALNRGGLEVQGTRVGQRSLRAGRSLAVVMIDVDHFKLINDTYGHPVGDEVLRHLTRLLKTELRPYDVLARYGGEEFVLVLDGLDLQSATRVADRLRGCIEAALVGIDHVTVRYTASVGVVTSNEHGYDLSRLIAAGDAAMYQAKRAGRNQVVCG